MKKLLIYLKPYIPQTILAPLFKFLEAVFDILVPLVVASVIDVGIANGDKGYIINMCLVLVLLAFVGLVCSVTAQFFAAKAATGFAAKLRSVLFEKINTLSYSQIDKLGTPKIITRITGDVMQIQNGVNLALRLILRSPFIVLGAIIAAFWLDTTMAWVLCAVLPFLALAVWFVIKFSVPLFKKSQGNSDKVLGKVRENISGARVIRAFCAEDSEKAEFTEENIALAQSQIKAGGISALLNPLTYAIINIGVIALLYTGAIRIDGGFLTQGAVMALYNYTAQILTELVKFANTVITLSKSIACGARIQEVLDMPEDIPSATGKTSDNGFILFKDVSLYYNGTSEPALSQISFTVNKGMTVGVIGGTGSGKTSLINMIPRFYPATEGSVFVDGKDVKDYDADELLSKIAIVPQKATLFKGTIRENLLWGNENASEEDITSAITIAQATDVIASKTLGLDEPVEQGGKNFSGGPRQRLTIARALVKKPEILILDDSSSALDFATDANLRKAISEIKDTTVFIAAQRASSVMNADLIIVLDDGKAVGMGTHESLLQTCDVYKEIYTSQFPEEDAR